MIRLMASVPPLLRRGRRSRQGSGCSRRGGYGRAGRLRVLGSCGNCRALLGDCSTVPHSMCGQGARWCARADAIFDVPGMHVLDVRSMISALTTPDQHAGRYPAVTHAQIRRALNPTTVRAGKSGLRHLLLQLSGVEERVGESEGGVVSAGGQHWHQRSRDVSGEVASLRPVKDRHASSDGSGANTPPWRSTRRASASAPPAQLDTLSGRAGPAGAPRRPTHPRA